MVQKIWKKKKIFIAMALFLGMMSVLGIFLLAKDGEEAIRNLGYDRYIEWTEGTDIHVGKIIDSTGTEPVSYTHLDVYKRQTWNFGNRKSMEAMYL